ncbi:hypothetical protein CQY20_06165 [Mycolicibacterium agri]|uniref:PE-PGRS family protein n=1 Tax=Mycolicibacterium agri TaxID=36811 RepID=A0A2A7NAS2_MYCAG|nr:hypothetical protein [Mycolicibacterium agri]PEG41222.1 hypothetical protein CQY20_06165 [Mycolicibacterium agri]GFG55327.1 hypothetical protein MAGR_67680 [Mycolicibacterium agri]
MQAALRPYATAGIALVGASVIAVSPVTVPPSAVEEVRGAAVELSALVNPIDVFAPVFEEAVANLQAVGELIGADPVPILAQIITNQINGVGNIGAALEAQVGVLPRVPELLLQAVAGQLGTISDLAGVSQSFVENLTEVLFGTEPGTVQGNLQEALEFLQEGDFGQAFQFLAAIPLLTVLGPSLANLELLPTLTQALQRPLADAAELLPIAAGPLANAQAALGVLGNPLNLLVIGVGALTTIGGVADAAGNTVGALIDGLQSGDFETTFNTIVNEAANGTSAVLTGALDLDFGIIAGLQRLREAIAAAITTPSFPPPPETTAAVASVPTTAVTSAPTKAAQSFTFTAPLQKTAPAPKDDAAQAEEPAGAVDAGTTTPTATEEVSEETTPTAKETTKDGNLVILDSTATKSNRPRAHTGSNFAKGLRDAARKTIKGITGFGRDKKSDSSTSTSTSSSSGSGSAGSTSGGSSAGDGSAE